MMQQIDLHTPGHRTEILVGKGLTEKLSGLGEGLVLLVDEEVMRLHKGLFADYEHILVPRGEASKTLATVEDIYRKLAALGADRSSFIVGVGGGLATDVAGYVASTYLRGLRFGFISTTLLGMVDASIGGKNGVNLDGYKNMVGCIRQPEFVWCDLDLIATLPEREYVSGLAEVIKYGAICDITLLDYLDDHMETLLEREPAVLEEVVSRCAAIKADVVRKDEHEGGLRRILNFGHTLGHALERNSDHLHGEAIAAGMRMAAELSLKRELITKEELSYLTSLISRTGLPLSLDCDPELITANILKDKKKTGSRLHFIFLQGLGDTLVRAVSMDELKNDIHDLC